MRPIICRGKRIDDEEWIEGYLVCKNDVDVGSESEVFIVDKNEFSISSDWNGILHNSIHQVDPKTVGQYTGLKDRNGEMIFEGDMIDHPNNVVFFKNGSFMISDDIMLSQIHPNMYYIIGNIYDFQ